MNIIKYCLIFFKTLIVLIKMLISPKVKCVVINDDYYINETKFEDQISHGGFHYVYFLLITETQILAIQQGKFLIITK